MSVAGSARFNTSRHAPATRKAPQLTGGTLGGVYWVKEKKETDELKINRRNPTQQKQWQTGDVYKGSWLGDRRHGFGIQIWSNGNKYEGSWHHNKRHSHGVLWIKDDPTAAAAAKSNKLAATTNSTTHIHASLTSTHQHNLQSAIDKQKAAAHMAALTAQTGGINLSAATQQAAAAAAVMAGANPNASQHVSAIPDGNGPVFDPMTKLRKLYAGNWKDGLKHGRGVYFYTNGASYEGEWRNGVRYGRGTLYLSGGDVYVGEWRDDKQAGFGTLTKGNGDIYEGNWLNGKREGDGMYYYKSKEQIFEGEWVADIPKCGVFMAAADFFVGKEAAAQAAAAKAKAAAAPTAASSTATTGTAATAAGTKTDSKYPLPATAATLAPSASGSSSASAASASASDELQRTLGSLRISDALAAVSQLPNSDPAILATQLPRAPDMINVGGSADDLFDTPRFIRKEPKKPLPELRLANADLVLAERIEEIQNARAAVRAMAAVSLEELFDAEMLDELRRIYAGADDTGSGLIPLTALKSLLESAGEPVTDAELASLCVDLDKNASDRIQFAQFVKAVHLAKHLRAIDKSNASATAAQAEAERFQPATDYNESENGDGDGGGDGTASAAGGAGGSTTQDQAGDTDDLPPADALSFFTPLPMT